MSEAPEAAAERREAICAYCGSPFAPRANGGIAQRFCGAECRTAANRRLYYARHREKVRAQQSAYYRANESAILRRSRERLANQTKEQRELQNARQRQRYDTEGAAARERARKQTAARRAADPERHRRYDAKRDPMKARAKQLVRNAIRRGELVREPCESCGATPAQAHHDDYSRPLEVRWLCSVHHGQQHRKDRNAR